MAFFSALGNFLKRPEEDYGVYQPVEQSRSGGIGPMQMPQVSPPIPSEPVPSHAVTPPSGPMGPTKIGPEPGFFGNLERQYAKGDIENLVKSTQRVVDTTNIGASLDDVAARMGKPAGSFSTELKRIYDQWGGHYNLSLKDKSRYSSPDDSIGYIEMGARPIEGHLPISMTYLGDSYHGTGLGGEMYREAIEKVKEKGFRGLASDPDMRNDFSNQIWDRPGITSIDRPGGYKYELMSEYIPRGKDWVSTPFKGLFKQDMAEQPMLPGVKEFLLDQMRNKSFQSAGVRPNPLQSIVTQQNQPTPDYNAFVDRLIREVNSNKSQRSLFPFFDFPAGR